MLRIRAHYIEHTRYQNKISTLPGYTYVRHPRREAYVASEQFFPEARRRDSWHYQVASLQLQSQKNVIINHGPQSIWHISMYNIFLSERAGGVGRPRSEAPFMYYYDDVDYVAAYRWRRFPFPVLLRVIRE